MRSSNLYIIALSCLFFTSALSASRQPDADVADEEQQDHGKIIPYGYPSTRDFLSSDRENRKEVPMGCFSSLCFGIFNTEDQSEYVFDSIDLSTMMGVGESFYTFLQAWREPSHSSDPVDIIKKNQ